MQNNRKALVVIMAAVGVNLVGGIVYCWSIISKELIVNLQWTSTEASWPYTICILITNCFMAFGGRVRDKAGPRVSTLTGGVLMGSGMFMSSFCTTPLTMSITFGLIAGAGMGFTNSSTTVTAIKWFPAERKGMVSGICMAGVAFAAVYLSPIIQWLLAYSDIYITFRCIGIGTFVIVILLSLLLSEAPGELSPSETKDNDEWKKIFKNPFFYKMSVMCFLGKTVGFMIIGHVAVIAVKQAQWNNGFLLVILVAIFNGAGRFLVGMVSDKIGPKNTFRMVFLLQAVNMVFFHYFNTVLPLGIGTAVAGFCYGGLISTIPAAIASELGTRNLGINFGLVSAATAFAGVLGPIMAGRSVDITGHYHFAYLTAAALLIVSAIIASTMKKNYAVC